MGAEMSAQASEMLAAFPLPGFSLPVHKIEERTL